DKVVERSHRLVKGGIPVRPMYEINVNVISAKILQALLDRFRHTFAAAVAEIRCVRITHAEFGRDDCLFAPSAERLGQRPLRGSKPISFGGIERIDAEVKCPIYRLDELRFFNAAVASAYFPTADAERGYLNAGLAE